MYPKYWTAIAGICLLFFTACTGTRITATACKQRSKPPHTPVQTTVALSQPVVMGPPEYIPDTIVKKAAPPIVERGGKYVLLPPPYTRVKPEMGTEKYAETVLQQKVNQLKRFAIENNYDTTVAFFIDMQVKSGHNRFLVVDLSSGAILKKALVAHGKGNEQFTFNRKFSNDEGSNCTSLGMYKIGKAYTGAFGLSYKLYGLSKTNNNALKRYVVLHAMGSIPETESKWPITQTEGCPAVAPSFLAELAPVLDKAEKNILLYIYFGNDNK
jgi:L,D-transpeptidase catalytic domain